MGSLIAAVPGNFLGFYLMGWYIKKKFTWGRFITAGIATLVLANLIVAALYVGVYMNLFMGQLPDLSVGGLFVFIIGLTVWWFVTMLPFVVLVTPPLIRAVAKAIPFIVDDELRDAALTNVPDRGLMVSLLVPGVIMLLVGLTVSYTAVGGQLEMLFGAQACSLIEVMSYASGVILAVLGGLVFLRVRSG